MARIHGILNNASGVRPNTKIVLEAAKTTNDVVIYAPDQTITTGANGAYDFECKPSFYNVVIIQQGFPREKVGIIQVYSDSVDGSLNEFLTTFKPDDLTPQILKDCINAKVAAESAANIADSKADEATLAANKAELAAESAAASGKIYKTIAEGIAATTSGDLFLVVSESTTGFSDLYLNDSGTGVYQGKTTIDVSALSEPVFSYKTSFLSGYINKLDINAAEWGEVGYWGVGSSKNPDASYKTTNYIAVKSGDKFLWQSNLKYIKLFAQDKTPIYNTLSRDGVTDNGASYVTIPAVKDGHKVAFAIVSSNTFESIRAGVGNDIFYTANIPTLNEEIVEFNNASLVNRIEKTTNTALKNGAEIDVNSIEANSSSYLTGFSNLFDIDSVDNKDGYYIAGGFSQNADYISSPALPFIKGKALIWFRALDAQIALFDANKNQFYDLWGGVDLGDGKRGGIIPDLVNGIPVKYFGITFRKSQLHKAVGYGTSIPISVNGYPFNTEIITIENESFKHDIKRVASGEVALSGKKWAFLGDSITASPVCYARQIVARNAMSSWENGAASGARMGVTVDESGAPDPYLHMSEVYVNIPDDVDYITVAAGTNDNAIPLGTMSDRTDRTFYGACHVVIKGILEKYPDKKFGVIGILQRTTNHSGYVKYRDRSDIIKEVAEYYAVPFLDIYRDCNGLCANVQKIKELYVTDGLHPNEAGHTIYASKVEPWLKTI